VALTVAQVLALPELGLVLRTESAPVDRLVRWVAVSELLDPTPWIEGGDLLLTTGMSILDDPDRRRPMSSDWLLPTWPLWDSASA
jgi:purine catabolism regulator